MVGWGLLSAAMMFVSAPWQFYLLRFLLGVFEAGFFPGIILYLTYWYPSGMRARIIAIFMSAIAIAGLIGGPLSGWIMEDMAGVNGWHGWQWMFLLEGLPATVLGIITLFLLADHPDQANWLSGREKEILDHNLAEDRKGKDVEHHHTFGQALRDPKIYVMSFAYFTFICGVYVISFWLPSLIKSLGVADPLQIGLYSVIPYTIGAVGMVLISRHSDQTLERRWHCAGAAFLGAAGLILSTLVPGSLPLALAALSLATLGVLTTMPVFWSIPSSYLTGNAKAGGIALINSLGLVGGFVSPFVIGWIKNATGSADNGLYVMAALLVVGGLTLLGGVSARLLRERHQD